MPAAHKAARTAPLVREFTNSPWTGIVPEIEALALVSGRGFLFWPPQLTASFISNQVCAMSLLLALSVIRGDAPFCPLSDNSGHGWVLARDYLSASDPKRTLQLMCGTYIRRQHRMDQRAAFSHWDSPLGFARRCGVEILSIPTD